MRLFVNVYKPGSAQNCAHRDLSLAVAAADASTLRECVEIEVPDGSSISQIDAQLEDLTREEIRRRYPLSVGGTGGTCASVRAPSIHESMQFADGHGASHAPSDVAVGDLNSAARGTGARKNSGKPDWSQLPLWAIWPIVEAYVRGDDVPGILPVALRHMTDWQRGDNAALEKAGAVVLRLLAIHDKRASGVLVPVLEREKWPSRAFIHVVRVLEFGAKKYAKGNWAKGMSWSVCYSCVLSHLTKALEGEQRDEESGELHLAHALCNIVFLLGYRDLFPEGDDRLPEFEPGGVKS